MKAMWQKGGCLVAGVAGLIGAVAVALPTFLHSVGLHPNYKRLVSLILPGRRVLRLNYELHFGTFCRAYGR